MQQPQKAIPAAAPFKKFLLLVVIEIPLGDPTPAFPFEAGRFCIAGLFLLSSPGTLPSRKREGNHSGRDRGRQPRKKPICFERKFACVCFVH
jgi:hypothetical protein